MGLYYPQAAMVLNVRWEDGTSAGRESVLSVRPQSVNVHLNDYTEADTFDATLDYKNFPFDPRSIRAIGVVIHMENMGSLDEEIVPAEDNSVFVGFVDESSISFDDASRTVTFEGRDLTSLFIDEKFPAGRQLDTNRTVKEIIQFIVGLLGKATEKIEIVALDDSAEKVPAFTNVDTRRNYIPLAPSGRTEVFDPLDLINVVMNIQEMNVEEKSTFKKMESEAKRGGNKEQIKRKETFWDVITRIAHRNSLIAYMSKDKLILRRARDFYQAQTRTQLTYGHNLSSLEFERKTGRRKKNNIRVTGYSPTDKVTRSVLIPGDVDANKFPALRPFVQRFGTLEEKNKNKMQTIYLEELDKDSKPTGTAKAADLISFVFPNVTEDEELLTRGTQVFEEINRQHLEGNFESRDMVFFNTDGTLADFSDLEIGSYITVGIRMDDLDKIRDIEAESDREEYLRRLGYSTAVAREFARSLSTFNYNFYLRSVEFSLDEDGFRMNGEIINLIEIDQRPADAANPLGPIRVLDEQRLRQ